LGEQISARRTRADTLKNRSSFQGDDERVFCNPTGSTLDPERYAATLRLALAKAKIEKLTRTVMRRSVGSSRSDRLR
jgi:hypothetical protein